MASNGIIDFDGKQIYVPEWALDDSVQTLVGISQSILNNLARQTKIETDSQGDQRKSNDTNARLLRDISANTAESKRSNEDFRENSKRLMSTFTSSRNSFVATQNAMDSLTNLSSNLGSRIEDLRGKVADTGLNFESYSALIVKNNDIMKRFGSDLVDGSNNFAALSKRIRESIGDSARYGVSVETLNQMILDEIDVRIRAGKTQEEINTELSTGFRRTIDTITALSVATDTAVSDIVDSTRRLKSSDAVRTFIEAGTQESRRLEEMLPGLTAIFSSIGDVGDTLVSGIVESIATNTDVMAYENGRIADILNTGGTELSDNFVALVDFMKTALTSGIRGVEEADLATNVLSNLSSGLAVMGEEVVKNKDILETASKAGDKNAEQLISLGAATQAMSQNFTMFSRTLANAQTEITATFDKIAESSRRPQTEEETPGWLASFLSRQFPRPDTDGKPTEVGSVYEEMSNLIDRFNRAMDNREQYKILKATVGGISLLVSSSIRTVMMAYNSLIRSDFSGAITSLVDGIGRVVSRLPLLGGVLGGIASGASFVLGTVFGAMEEYGRALQEMVGVGAGLGQSLESLRNSAASVGLDLGSLAKVVTSNARAMLYMGDSVGEGSMNFVAQSATIMNEAREKFNMFGMSNTELIEEIAREIEIRRQSGLSIQNLDQSMNELLFNTTAIANLQGIERKELLRRRQEQAEKDAFSTFIARMDSKEAERLTMGLTAIEAKGGGEIAKAIRVGLQRGVNPTRTPEFAQFAMLLKGEERQNLEDFVRAALSYSEIDDKEFYTNLTVAGGKFAASISDETLKVIGVYGSFNESFAENLAKFISEMRGLPTDLTKAAEVWTKTGTDLQKQSALAISSTMEQAANALKTSVLLTALKMVGESGQTADSMLNVMKIITDNLYQTVDGVQQVTPIDELFKMIAQRAEQSENPMVSALGTLTDAILSPTGLNVALWTLVGAVAAQTAAMTAIAGLSFMDFIRNSTGRRPGPGGSTNMLGRISKFGRILGKASIAAVVAAGALGAYGVYSDEDMTPEQKKEEYAGIAGETGGALAGMWAGAKLGALGGTAVLPGIGTAIGGAVGGLAGGLGGYFGGGMLGRLFGSGDFRGLSDSPEISGGAGDTELGGGAGTDTLGASITQTTEELMLSSQLNSRLDSLLTKYDEEIEILKTQNQILVDTMSRVMETNRILENYVRVYKENAI